ncbi:MAG: hypothetical protein WBL63_04700 [Candidatus Acidiferrum sp.]
MRLPILVSFQDQHSLGVVRRLAARLFLLLWLGMLCVSTLAAQQTSDDTVVDKQTLRQLLERIDQLEARVRQLEADKQQTNATIPTPAVDPANPTVTMASLQVQTSPGNQATYSPQTAPAPSPSQEQEQTQTENIMMERMDLSKTLLRIRGFGDISLHGDTQKGDTTSFSLGQLDLFVSSDISDKFKFLSEIVFEGGPSNIYGQIVGQKNTFGVDVERYLLQYSYSDYLNISAGRGHTAIGYYNTAYHHSTWLQTTEGRPFLFEFEDHGGILPVHTVGVSASGLIPSGRWGLHYVAEVGNGRASRVPLQEEPVQNVIDDQNHKAFNLALFARPEAVRGLQAGFSVYRDVLAPTNSPRIGETILAAHAVLIRSNYEWLNEALLVRHAALGTSNVFNTPGFYTQLSRQFGSFRPYFRYQYVNAPNSEPIFSDVALRHGPSLGLRYDVSEFVALKFQYDYTFLRRQPEVNGLSLQLGFTF